MMRAPRESGAFVLAVDDRISLSVGTYQLIAEIARGGMGRVCLCRRAGEAGFQRLFALKLMHPHLATEDEFVDMLLDEAHLAARINHPNVVGIVDLGRYDGGYFLVMDYIEGASFHELLSRRRFERSPSLIIPIALDALRGLGAAHAQTDEDGEPLGIVHRDVSPHNVLVGVDGSARITDFGIAKASARISVTRPGTRKGKFEYMAPEQITSGECDVRTDVFSFGVMLWTALTGERLFRGETDGVTLHNVMNRPIAPPSTVGLKPPACLDAPILRALEREPSSRTPSAEELAHDLRRAAMANGLLGSRDDVGAWVKEVFGDQLKARRDLIAATRKHAVATVVGGELAVVEASPLPSLSTSLPPPPEVVTTTASTVAPPIRVRVKRRGLLLASALGLAVGLTAAVGVGLAKWDTTVVEVPKIRKPPEPVVKLVPVREVIVAAPPEDAVAPQPRTRRRGRRARARRASPMERMDNNPYLLGD